MANLVPDVEQIRYLRRKSLLSVLRNLGLIFLGSAAFGLYRQDWQANTLLIAYVAIGLCLLVAWRWLKRRSHEVLSWTPDKR